jgi:ribosome-interacting GTPase 1
MKKGATLEDFTKEIHKDFQEKLKFARVWGSTAFDGQMVQRDYVLQEGDVVELRI